MSSRMLYDSIGVCVVIVKNNDVLLFITLRLEWWEILSVLYIFQSWLSNCSSFLF